MWPLVYRNLSGQSATTELLLLEEDIGLLLEEDIGLLLEEDIGLLLLLELLLLLDIGLELEEETGAGGQPVQSEQFANSSTTFPQELSGSTGEKLPLE